MALNYFSVAPCPTAAPASLYVNREWLLQFANPSVPFENARPLDTHECPNNAYYFQGLRHFKLDFTTTSTFSVATIRITLFDQDDIVRSDVFTPKCIFCTDTRTSTNFMKCFAVTW